MNTKQPSFDYLGYLDNLSDTISMEDYEVTLALSDTHMYAEDLFSDISLEGIAEKAKEMASNVKTNFKLYFKKFVNFAFGWIINFFKQTTDVKKIMASGYDQAKKYLEKLNKLESKARGSNEKIEISPSGNSVIISLVAIQLIKHFLSTYLEFRENPDNIKNLSSTFGAPFTTGESISIEADEGTKDSDDSGSNDKDDVQFKLTDAHFFMSAIFTLVTGMAAVLKLKYSALYDLLKRSGYDIAKFANTPAFKDSYSAGNTNLFVNAKTSAEMMNKVKATLNTLTENANKSKDSSKELKEIEVSKAFDMIRENLKAFMAISKTNKWDFAPLMKNIEKKRKSLVAEIEKIDPSKTNEKVLSTTMSIMLAIGNLTASTKKLVDIYITGVSDNIKLWGKDINKLGSVVIKLGGNSDE